MSFLTNLSINNGYLRFRDHTAEELAFYSKGICDTEYNLHSQIGWGELWRIADRTDYDLKQHQEASKESLEYLDPATNEKYLVYCVEPAVGVERLMLASMCDAYDEEELENDTRIVMHLHPFLAPIKAYVMPFSKKLSNKATEIFQLIAPVGNCNYDEAGSTGKRYHRQDAIGTPFCITVDFETENDNCVTVRHRNSTEQERVSLKDLSAYIEGRTKL